MHRHKLPFLTAILALAASASAQTPQLHELPGMAPSDATADGSTVVGNGPTGQYFMWTAAGGAIDIGGLANFGTVRIADDGSRVGGTAVNGTSGLNEMSIYDASTGIWTNLGGLGGSSGSDASSGWDISADGQHVVGLGWIDGSEAHATQWSEGVGTFDLGSTAMGQSSRANAVSADGRVVAGWQDGNGRQAAVWHDGVQTLLTAQDGTPLQEASGVSANGEWVIGIGSSGTMDEAWRWSQATGTQALGSLGLSGFPPPRGFATSISADGSVIIGFDRGFGPPTDGEGWIWTEDTGLVSLDDYLAAQGLVVSDNLRLSVPLGIAADGRTLVGVGRSDVAFSMGWVVTLGVAAEPISGYCYGEACPCGNDDPAAGCANSTGAGALLSHTGTASIAADDLVLTATQLPPNKFGLIYRGPEQGCSIFGDGMRAVRPGPPGTFSRFTVQPSGPDGTFSVGAGLASTLGVLAGETVNFQAYFRDGSGPCGTGFNLSNGLSVTFTD